MNESFVNIRLGRDLVKLLREWRIWVEKIAIAVKKRLPDAEIYVIGSVAEDALTGGSDIDILIVSENIPRTNFERSDPKTEVVEEVGLPLAHPFEIHLASWREFEFYKKFAKKMIKIL